MPRASLAEWRSLPAGPALYCVNDRGAEEPIYFGETAALRARAMVGAVADWPVRHRQGGGRTTDFLAKASTLDANWRAVVLFGRNVASYKRCSALHRHEALSPA